MTQDCPGRRFDRPALAAAVAGRRCCRGLGGRGRSALWAYYGTTVFFEMVRDRLGACF